MNYQNNIGGEERQIKSASKFLGIELIFIILFISLTAFALNYFNLLPLSQMFPGQLGWLPHREVVKFVEKNEINETPVPFEDLSPRDKLMTYASETLNPKYLPKDFSGELGTDVLEELDIKAYFMDFNELGMRIEYYESISGSRFDQDGIPLLVDIIVSRIGVNATEVALDNIRNYLGGFFTFTEDDILWREFNVPDGSPAIETFWENPDGTIEIRASRRYGQTAPDGTGNSRNFACRRFPESPSYELRTCFE
ncbi:MAG: hypothetical protein A2868_02970 [Candidatus Levybacteria bacterium RIFCSPHIGHO2_01_FULL_40_15b]|nr:MAG: hypothetical protein A2868_02970 [Candidatus Levybacteria bacterium RIFCSPHIGHO2_01_FULL_40_15b]